MSYKQKNTKTIEGVVKESMSKGDDLNFSLYNRRELFNLQVVGARVNSGDKVKVYLMGRKIMTAIDDNEYERVRALEILNENGSIFFTYISGYGPNDNLGEWEWNP